MNKEIEIPEGYEARIEGNKVILEPKESEDEKIRKELLEEIEFIIPHDDETDSEGLILPSYHARIDRYKSYIEKQKEQKPKMIQWTGKNLKEVIDFTGKSPRFDEWFKSWEDFENYVHTHNDILKLFCEDGSHYEVPVGAWIVKTPDGYNTPSSFRFIQKPTEWSETDKLHLNNAILVAKKEWGVNSYTARFLESLRDNYKKCNSHWKPSEEQMKALENVIKCELSAGLHARAEILQTLQNDLKEL